MIIDVERNRGLYYGALPELEEGFGFIDSLKEKPPGRYEKGDMYALVQEGVTKPAGELRLEAHKKYIDVQYMAEGFEVMEWANSEGLKEAAPYDSGKDIVFYNGEGMACRVSPGMFYIVFPEDAHKPCGYTEKETSYRKIVLKIKAPQQIENR